MSKVIYGKFGPRASGGGIPSQAEYERTERALFHADVQRAGKAPLNEQRKAGAAFYDALKHRPHVIVERIGWLLAGNYGYGSYQAAREVIRRPRMNRGAWLTTIIAALEWSSPHKMTVAAWKKLTPHEQEHLRQLIEREVQDALRSE